MSGFVVREMWTLKSSRHTPWVLRSQSSKRTLRKSDCCKEKRNQLINFQQRKLNAAHLIRFIGILIGCVCIAVLPAVAENYTGDFLTSGVGGRALGLGGAYVSIADDATATYWNPAGIAGVTDNYQFCLMHAARRSGLGTFNYISGTRQILPKLNLGTVMDSGGGRRYSHLSSRSRF